MKDALRALAALGWTLSVLVSAPQPAPANVPSPVYSTCDTCLVIAPGYSFLYRVILRDDANTPIPFASVSIDFNGVTGTALCSIADPDADGRVVGTTDGAGVVDFFVRGGGVSNGYVTVSSVATTLCLARVRSPDLDANLLVDASDEAAHSSLPPSSLSGDYDCDSDTDSADLALLMARLGENCATVQSEDRTWGRIKALYR